VFPSFLGEAGGSVHRKQARQKTRRGSPAGLCEIACWWPCTVKMINQLATAGYLSMCRGARSPLFRAAPASRDNRPLILGC